MADKFDAIVIGSGFGGAGRLFCRLAKRSFSVLVLDHGRISARHGQCLGLRRQ